MGLFGKKQEPQAVHLAGTRRFDSAVVGESNYQRALAAICGGRSAKPPKKPVTATLVLDDKNKFDKNAVYIEIDGRKVGHLAREHAEAYRAQLRKAGLIDAQITCLAKIVGGGPDKSFGVLLDLPEEYS